jgi:enediyne biosynthesis protein E5
MTLHVVFGLFFALLLVCSARGIGLWVLGRRRAETPGRVEILAPARVAVPEPAALEVAER